MKRLLAILFLLTATCSAPKAQQIGMAYFDVNRLHDTLPSLFYDDSAFTPEGRFAWTSRRYHSRIRHTAAVIDSLSLPLIVLWGVENEEVVRDLVRALNGDYSYLHRTLNAYDGMDFALLYHADRFSPHHVTTQRRSLTVDGFLLDFASGRHRPLALILSHDPGEARTELIRLHRRSGDIPVILMGGMDPSAAILRPYHNALHAAELRGEGNRMWGKRWSMRDHIWTDPRLEVLRSGVYIRPYMIDSKTGKPTPPTLKGRKKEGFGGILPIFVYIRTNYLQ